MGVLDLHSITNSSDAVVEKEKVPVSIAVDSVLYALVHSVAQTETLSNIFLKKCSVFDAWKPDAL
jgi:hypothetical protein